MGFYNILETFFFISLAITFVLIMMLVYHFKGRISILEQKCDTMFDIMNNMVKEMKHIKYVFGMAFNQNQSAGETFHKYSSNLDNIQEENEEDEEDDSDEYDNEDVNKYLDKIVVSDNEEDVEDVEDAEDADDDKSVKIINIDLNDETNEINEMDEIVDLDTEELDVEQNEEVELDEDLTEMNDKPDFSEIIVNKLDITIDPANENGEYLAKNEPMDYKKIDVSYLRTLAITRGLVSDTKRLKKQDLVRLLGQSDETE